ncbi:MAG: geranylgeranyl reductase family protein [Chloroflexi bacterium]|nr:geranylgeranyl reductase family protein [Chloroflexota bacterium]
MIYDVIVVGAGPGGATAAYNLARQNANVLLFEKERLPRYKACGGGLTAKVMPMLDFDISSTIEDEARNVLLSYDSGPTLTMRHPRTAVWCVMRDKFDHRLAQRAVECGARLMDGAAVEHIEAQPEHVVVRAGRETYQARFVVGADGANGVTARSVGLLARRQDGVALEAEIQVPPTAQEKWRNALLLDFGSPPWGYSWIFPKAEHLSIGVGVFRSGRGVKLREYLARFIEHQPTLRNHGAMFTKGHRIPLGGRPERLHRGRVALVGDAAAVADPLLGEGIAHAIHSGQVAASVIAGAIQRGDADLSEHTRRLNREINADFRFARAVMHVFYRWPRLCYRLFVQGGLLNSAANVVDGTASYRQLLLTAVTQTPLIVGRQFTGAH